MLGRRRLATSFVEIWVSLGPLSKKWSIQSSKYKKWLVLVLLWWFWQFDVGGASKFKGGLCLAHKVQNVEPLPVTTWNKADFKSQQELKPRTGLTWWRPKFNDPLQAPARSCHLRPLFTSSRTSHHQTWRHRAVQSLQQEFWVAPR